MSEKDAYTPGELEKALGEATTWAASHKDGAHVWWIPQLLKIIRELEAEVDFYRDRFEAELPEGP